MIKAYPKLAAAQSALDAGRYEEAARVAVGHVRDHPEDPRGLGMLGTVAMRMGALGQSEAFLRQALAKAPGSDQIAQELAQCLHQQERPTEALHLFGQLEKEKPGDAQIGLMVGLILDKLGRAEEAHDRLELLARKHPDNSNIWLALAHNLRSSGDTDAAVDAYRRAIAIDEERGDAWWGIASIKKKLLSDEDVATMQKALAIAIDVANIAPLHFALARAWQDRGEHAKAFDHYQKGNQVRAESIGYNRAQLTEEVDTFTRLLTAQSLARGYSADADGPTPIFLVSLPRSGSTLLEQMVGSHPDIAAAGELPYLPALLRSTMEMHTRRGTTEIPQMIAALSDDEARSLGKEYLRRASLHHPGDVRYFVDKLPHNWSNIPFIRRILPQAKFVDIRRPAMDCCFANFTQSFSRAHAASFALEDIGQCYVDYVRLMDHLDLVAPDLVAHVSYARLIDQPEPELRPLFDYLGLPWSDAPLNFHKLNRVVRTPSAEQVRQPLNRKGVGVWRPYAEWLGPLRDKLGPLAEA
ncbi:tetratricopeptide repeat-containing sulfotransferase family protein [Sphingomonas xanthus]|uniref:Tetratricopeptide repeat protein n=1 Tax=Sphingomonas xanthus TaxID=2594473 RepID=A0A516IRD0_9SPHN|nr:sulfotransferase [Sphingomonas xanthus]QDP19354.1 tetratricopeptide repeat protein [Sphingomonas xanthus]